MTEQEQATVNAIVDKLNASIDEKFKAHEETKISLADFETHKAHVEKLINEVKKASDFEGIEKRLTDELAAQRDSIAKLSGKLKAKVDVHFDIRKTNLRSVISDAFDKAGITKEYKVNEGLANEETRKKIDLGLTTNSKIRVTINFNQKEQVAKAGESIFVTGGDPNQAVFEQAINRFVYGDDRPALSADDHAIDVMPTKNVTGTYMTLMVFENYENGTELVQEGGTPANNSRIEMTSKDFKVFTVRAKAKTSKEALRDKEEVIDELIWQLRDSMKNEIDEQVLQGTGDNSTAPYGAFNTTQSCFTFNPLEYTGTVTNPTIPDVISKAKLDVRLRNYKADLLVINPVNSESIEADKATDANSVQDRRVMFVGGELTMVKKLAIMDTTKISTNELLIATSALHDIGLRQDMELEFGYNNDDFEKGLVSLLMDLRFGYGVRNLNGNCYVDDLATALAVLGETPAESLVRVQGYATGSDASELTIATLVNTGVENVITSNLEAYKVAIAAEASIADLAALQVVVDAVNAA